MEGTAGARDAETDKIAEFRKMVDNIKEGHIKQLEREVNDWNHKILNKVSWKVVEDSGSICPGVGSLWLCWLLIWWLCVAWVFCCFSVTLLLVICAHSLFFFFIQLHIEILLVSTFHSFVYIYIFASHYSKMFAHSYTNLDAHTCILINNFHPHSTAPCSCLVLHVLYISHYWLIYCVICFQDVHELTFF